MILFPAWAFFRVKHTSKNKCHWFDFGFRRWNRRNWCKRTYVFSRNGWIICQHWQEIFVRLVPRIPLNINNLETEFASTLCHFASFFPMFFVSKKKTEINGFEMLFCQTYIIKAFKWKANTKSINHFIDIRARWIKRLKRHILSRRNFFFIPNTFCGIKINVKWSHKCRITKIEWHWFDWLLHPSLSNTFNSLMFR